MFSAITCNQSVTGVTDNNDINKISSVCPNVASTTATRESPSVVSDIITRIEPNSKSSGSDNNNPIPLIAGVIASITVLIGSGIVLVVVLLLMKARYTLDKIEVTNL